MFFARKQAGEVLNAPPVGEGLNQDQYGERQPWLQRAGGVGEGEGGMVL